MNREEQLKFLKEITEAKGISGDEKEVSRVMKSYLEGYADEFDYDNLGSFIAVKKGDDDLKVMLAAHMDEVGFVVSQIEESGFIRMNKIGGWWGHVLLSQRMDIKTMDDKVYQGIVGSMPPHGMSPEVKARVMDIDKMYIDLGVESKKEVLDMGINIGDSIIPHSEFMVMNNPDYLCSKAFDDRIGTAIVVEVMRNLKNEKHPNTLYSVGSVQEEVGLRGAKTVTYKIQPDVALAIDVSKTYDIPGMSGGESKLGKGPSLSIMDATVIANKGLLKVLRDICREKNIPFTHDILSAGGTDSGEIHKSYDGVINMTISLPCRYFHSHNSIINIKDYNACIELLTEFVKRLDKNMLEEFKNSKK